jgi:hypothetical protein
MADAEKIRALVNGVVSDILDTRLHSMHEEFVRRVMEELEPHLMIAPGNSPTDRLERAIGAVHAGTSQGEILTALLEGASTFSGRAILFVLRGGGAVAWQARGFRDNDAVRALTIEAASGLAASAVNHRSPALGPVAQFDPHFVAVCGDPSDGTCIVLPLVIGSKVAALVYADGGAERRLDSAALQILARTAGMWLETLALRKNAGSSTSAPAHSGASMAPPAMPTRPGGSQFAPAAAAVSPPMSAPRTGSFSTPTWQPVANVTTAPSNGNGASTAGSESLSEDEEEVHRKARRFAKLLVDEIKLYNQAKVLEGKQHRDLYVRIKDDLEKSRATYDKRYANTPAASGDYFNREVIRNLADNNPALLGTNFPN